VQEDHDHDGEDHDDQGQSAPGEGPQNERGEEGHVLFAGFDGDEVVLRVTATPVYDAEGRQLADQVLAALSRVAGANRPRAVA